MSETDVGTSSTVQEGVLTTKLAIASAAGDRSRGTSRWCASLGNNLSRWPSLPSASVI